MLGVLLMLVPLVAAVIIMFAPARAARGVALIGTLVGLGLAILAAIDFNGWGSGGWGLEFHRDLLPSLGISLTFGADSVSMLLVLLTVLLMPLAVIGSWTAVTERLREYYAWLLVLSTAMIGVFLARDLLVFYVCFEFTLVPMFFLIAIYGSTNRAWASVKFFLYTFLGSLFAFTGFLYVAWANAEHGGVWSFSIPDLAHFASTGMTSTEQAWVLLALMAGFAVKIPLFPVHTWLPLAHTEAPTAGSVLLAAVLLKLGTYGLYRFVLPMTPSAVVDWAPLIGILAIVGILYAALICWVQTDVKKLVAYSSVSHLGFCVLGLFALNPLGLQGSVLYMINHGLSTGALFFMIGMMYERYHTRDMGVVGGLAAKMPVWSFFMVFFVLASVGLPGLNGFVSEFLCLIGTFAAGDVGAYPGVLGPWFAAFAALGMIFTAMYLLIMVGKVVFGPLREPAGDHGPLPADLTVREIIVLVPLAAACIWIGVQPDIIMDSMSGAIEHTLAVYPDLVSPVRETVAGAMP
ncbi:MAG: NADH-quinone oxidoreductase subunit M [Phycisphaerales bacterium]|jgi:NADH-quinone oxidoreductase subunit M|nr:NADH-quinone oxidoreductase subunit M [Phycisphaerales bacterium]MDP6311062.1 NADH-quinone oxidoreductase subunit M [Phycisphaerales bacterium]MDP7086450.1 NADH-quinone oxidoreductase subunit M [Phycisphaerales bacterium]MDP7189253.1 NADH-quinone oxidoreductase subunit M [Phycisphaerales bacterium]MDP7518979.1 NADH-quinone oxidoreductase subunit M [Phycisphaerales bacterium]|tara:strand:+ start:789 stop:2345 length:1557 start_codon:yes stop_codon:yes gene_type:complete